jgi:ABC-type uncharacterized transport system substrate-binding protein
MNLPLLARLVIGVGFLVLVFFVCVGNTSSRRQKVLVLHSYHQGLEWTDNITGGINESFSPYTKTYEVYYEYLDSKRNSGQDYFNTLYQLQKAKHQNKEYSIILVSDNNALNFAIEHGKELYGDIPMVFCGINNFKPELLAGRRNVTGVAENTDFEGTIQLIRELHPERKNITVIVDQTPTGMAIQNSLIPVFSKFPELTFVFYQDFLLSEVNERLRGLGPQDVIFLTAFNRDRDGNYISYTEGAEMIRSATDVPIFGSWEFYLGDGIIGGIITRGVDQGRMAAKMALTILDGKSPSDVPIEYSGPTVPMFDHHQLDRFDISPGRLPEGSYIINTPPTWLQRNAKLLLMLLVVFGIIVLAMGLRLFLLRRRTLRIAAMADMLEEKVNQRTEQLEAEKTKLKETLAQVRTLQGLLPICSACKKIRDDQGYWNQIESYIIEHTDAVFSHGICPECTRKLYPEYKLPE